MKYLKTFAENILIMILIFGGLAIFAKIFYPETLNIIPAFGEIIAGLKLWPIVILILLMSALPRRK